MYIKLPERNVPIIDETDVLVAGGGPAGIGAAVSAARQGVRVMLLERRGFLGGNITSSYVETCNHFMNNTAFHATGLYAEIESEYKKQFGRSDDIREDSVVHRFSSEYLKVFLDELMASEGVHVKLHSFVNDVVMENDRISAVIIQTKQGPVAVRTSMIVDATGDGDVAFSAGVPFEQGRASDGVCQPGTLNFRITGVDVGQIKGNKGGLNALSQYIYDMHAAGETSITCKRGWIAFGRMTSGGQISYLNCADVYHIDPTDVDDLTRGETEGRKYVMEYYNYLKKNIKGMENIELASIAPEMGFRDSRRIAGLYRLTSSDIECNKSFDDVIAVYPRFYDMLALDGDWSKGRGFDSDAVYITVEGDRSYQIPFRCLLPVKVDNLLTAGRCISADHLAESSLRAISACMLTGQAAGTAAAMACKENIIPRSINIRQLQKNLIGQDIELPITDM